MKFPFLIGCIPVALAACTPVPTPLPNIATLSQASSLDGAHTDVQYQSVIQDYEHRDATDPQDWRKSNAEQNSGWGAN